MGETNHILLHHSSLDLDYWLFYERLGSSIGKLKNMCYDKNWSATVMRFHSVKITV